MKIHLVENMDQVLKVALVNPLPEVPEEAVTPIPAPTEEIPRERYL